MRGEGCERGVWGGVRRGMRGVGCESREGV